MNNYANITVSDVISDLVQSVVTQGAKYIKIDLREFEETHIEIECMEFTFSENPTSLRSMMYEYILSGEHTLSGNVLGFKVDFPLGDLPLCISSLLSCNIHLVEFCIRYTNYKGSFEFSLLSAMEELGYVFIGEANVIEWVEERISSELSKLK